eukprot:CAMPEP_0205825838 /NCGR_PEP_ID=MMETSP0206-20130828/26645_1 /ASSEMBLY_ACC=CAM_ASM_000279 /TAXON_ID=36767 /ORGANISM="Euplotes focardii, Strain TN1" /LENGTH=240 /DNA_ID=CAMNT_0053125211 /DNA_START=24 /DNA_END=746 /DNA_ORIENTATION=+
MAMKALKQDMSKKMGLVGQWTREKVRMAKRTVDVEFHHNVERFLRTRDQLIELETKAVRVSHFQGALIVQSRGFEEALHNSSENPRVPQKYAHLAGIQQQIQGCKVELDGAYCEPVTQLLRGPCAKALSLLDGIETLRLAHDSQLNKLHTASASKVGPRGIAKLQRRSDQATHDYEASKREFLDLCSSVEATTQVILNWDNSRLAAQKAETASNKKFRKRDMALAAVGAMAAGGLALTVR